MRNKIIGLIGILAIIFSIIGYFTFDSTIKQSSELLGYNMAVFSHPIKSGHIITENDITSAKIKQKDCVYGAVKYTDKQSVIGEVALIDFAANEQILPSRIVDQNLYYEKGTEFVSFTTTFNDSVAATVKAGDLVDIWLKPTPAYPTVGYKIPERLFKKIRIEKIKTEGNQDLNQVQNGIPFIMVVSLTDEQIKVLKTYVPDTNSNTTFLTLYSNQAEENLGINSKSASEQK